MGLDPFYSLDVLFSSLSGYHMIIDHTEASHGYLL